MTAIRLICEPYTANEFTKGFDVLWDEGTGTVTGDGADEIIAYAKSGFIDCHPMPGFVHKFSKYPLKSKKDMAAIIGLYRRLPDALLPHYPSQKAHTFSRKTCTDKDGVLVIGADQITF